MEKEGRRRRRGAEENKRSSGGGGIKKGLSFDPLDTHEACGPPCST